MKEKLQQKKLPNWAIKTILLLAGIVFCWVVTFAISLVVITSYRLLSPSDITWVEVLQYAAYSGIAWTCYLVPKLDLTI